MTKEFKPSSKSVGLANKDNLAGWAGRSKSNSYHTDKTQLRHDIGTEGAAKDFKGDWSDDWQMPQCKSEGRGWAKAKATTADNTYTGPGGSKRR